MCLRAPLTRRFDLHDQDGFLASEQRICVAFANRCVWFGLIVYWHSLRLDVLALFMMALDSGKGYPHGVRPIPIYFRIAIANRGVRFGFLWCGCVYSLSWCAPLGSSWSGSFFISFFILHLLRDARQLAGGLARATSGAANWRERQLAGAPTGGGVKRDPDGVGALGPTHPGGLAAAPSLASLTA